MKAMTRFFLIFAALLVAVPAFADEHPATDFLRARHENVQRVMNRPAHGAAEEERRDGEVTHQLNDLLDYEELSQRALVDHWSTITEAQRHEFVDLLKKLVERNYRHNLHNTLDYNITYTSETASPQGVVVKTMAKAKHHGREPEIAIDYTVHQVNGVWKVVDIATDGVSLVRNYRSQFHRIITRESWDALIHRMREKLEKGDDM